MTKLVTTVIVLSVLLAGCGTTKPKACSDDIPAGFRSTDCGPKHPVNAGFNFNLWSK